MKTTRRVVPTQTIEEFADMHGLEMVITERRLSLNNPMRFSASFVGAEVGGEGLLRSKSGNGSSVAAAIADYARRISMQRLVIDAYKLTRREIDVPRLLESESSLT